MTEVETVPAGAGGADAARTAGAAAAAGGSPAGGASRAAADASAAGGATSDGAAPAGLSGAVVGATRATARGLPWRLRHRRAARSLLYGAVCLVIGAGALWRHHSLEQARQEGLMTRVTVAQQMYAADPDGVLRWIRTEVLDQEPLPDVRRRAQLTVAACFVAACRWDEAERTYAEVSSDWPGDLPRGPLTLPWAAMRLDAGRPVEALALLDAPGATAGWTSASQVDEVRARAKDAVAKAAASPGR